MATSGRAGSLGGGWAGGGTGGGTDEGKREEAIGHNANAASESASRAPPGLAAMRGGEEYAGQADIRRASFWLSWLGCLAIGPQRGENGGEEEEEEGVE